MSVVMVFSRGLPRLASSSSARDTFGASCAFCAFSFLDFLVFAFLALFSCSFSCSGGASIALSNFLSWASICCLAATIIPGCQCRFKLMYSEQLTFLLLCAHGSMLFLLPLDPLVEACPRAIFVEKEVVRLRFQLIVAVVAAIAFTQCWRWR